MTSNLLYVTDDGSLHELNEERLLSQSIPLVEVGGALRIEYLRLHVVSRWGWDKIGKSQVMVVAAVRHTVQKEAALDSVVLFDTKVQPREVPGTSKMGVKKKCYSATAFPADMYGHPTCFYTPGYTGSAITVTTIVKEIDDNSLVTSIARNAGAMTSSVSQEPLLGSYGVLFAIGGSLMQAGAAAIELLQSNTELARPHTVGFSLNRPGSPFYEGVYVLLPSENTNISDLMDKYYLGGDAQLLSRADQKEYKHSYYVMRVSTREDATLVDFDFAASAAGLLKLFHGPDKEEAMRELATSVVSVAQNAYYMGVIKDVQRQKDELDAGARNKSPQELEEMQRQLLAKYNQLGPKKQWFDQNIGTAVLGSVQHLIKQ